jgi:hypothetical protein
LGVVNDPFALIGEGVVNEGGEEGSSCENWVGLDVDKGLSEDLEISDTP